MRQNFSSSMSGTDPLLNGIVTLFANSAISNGVNHEYDRDSTERSIGTDDIRERMNGPDSGDILGIISMAVVKSVGEDGAPGYVISGGLSGNIHILMGLAVIISNKITEIHDLDKVNPDSQTAQ